jgi:hypothetical protein
MASSKPPGRLGIVQDFINTLEFSGGADDKFSAGPDELASWCRESGHCPDVGEAGLARLRDFREALRAVLETHSGEGEEPALWGALEPFAEQACYRMSITSDGRPALRPQGAGADGAIAELFAIIYDAASLPSRSSSCTLFRAAAWVYLPGSRLPSE